MILASTTSSTTSIAAVKIKYILSCCDNVFTVIETISHRSLFFFIKADCLNQTLNRYAMRVSPAICNRVVDAVRGVLNQFVSDIYIYTDHCKGGQSGKYVIL